MAKGSCFNKSRVITILRIFSLLLNLPETKQFERLLSMNPSHTYGDSCHLQESSTTKGAGVVTNIKSKCIVNKQASSQEFYQEISWEAPMNPSIPVTGYRIYISQETRTRICFQLPASKFSFNFTRPLGLANNGSFLFTVTSQPIARIKNRFTQNMYHAEGCLS